MTHKLYQLRQTFYASLLGALLIAAPAYAQQAGATLELRPHCSEGYDGTAWIYGPVPPPGWDIAENPDLCPSFGVRDPQTLQTEALQVGDELKLDLVVQNPNGKQISGVRMWLSYDATVLEGENIEVNTTTFPEIIPGEADFAPKNGFVKIHVNASDKAYPTGYWVYVGTITFRVTGEILPGTVLSFFDIQRDGHTFILANDAGTEVYALDQEPGSLFVQMKTGGSLPQQNSSSSGSSLLQAGEACLASEDCASGQCTEGICAPGTDAELQSCNFDGQCESATCFEGFCRDSSFRIPSGSFCRRDLQCASGVCSNGVCSGAQNLENGQGCSSNTECASAVCAEGVCRAQASGGNGSTTATASCFANEDCGAGAICSNGICTREQAQVPNGGACVLSTQCQSNLCVEGVCQDAETYQNDQTAFALLQVRNIRVTTEGEIAYLQWDALRSSMLKAYNVYYGTTSGQYIQRKTIQSNQSSLSIRNLPKGETYYFAVRAVSSEDEESAFSQEVAVEIGNPSTSTAPLIASMITDSPGEHPVVNGNAESLPGETGMGTIFAVLALLSAVVGTILASRRQLVTLTHTQ